MACTLGESRVPLGVLGLRPDHCHFVSRFPACQPLQHSSSRRCHYTHKLARAHTETREQIEYPVPPSSPRVRVRATLPPIRHLLLMRVDRPNLSRACAQPPHHNSCLPRLVSLSPTLRHPSSSSQAMTTAKWHDERDTFVPSDALHHVSLA